MPEAYFRWIDSTNKKLPRDLSRRPDTKIRLAHLTDPHVPGEIDLFGRLMDLVGRHGSVGGFSKEISAISNEFGHTYRKERERYTNLLKRTLFGLHQLEVDHLIMTGDLAHCGLAPEFLEMRAVLELTGWWGEDQLTVVAGNHDRFNLYEHIDGTRMEDYYPVVSPREAQFKTLPEGVTMLELDSNRAPDDPHALEQWLPNTVGQIYPEAIDWIDKHRKEIAGTRVLALVHHHVTDDWYPNPGGGFAGLMRPVEGFNQLLEIVEMVDPRALVLHGHKHDVMPVDYAVGPHRLSCPGGFHQTHTLNLIDFDVHDEETITQIEARL